MLLTEFIGFLEEGIEAMLWCNGRWQVELNYARVFDLFGLGNTRACMHG